MKPTETAYKLADEFYRYTVKRDLGLPPTHDWTLPHQCADCGMKMAADGFHGQRCIGSNGFTKLRHDSIERLLHNTVREGVWLAYGQQHNLRWLHCIQRTGEAGS